MHIAFARPTLAETGGGGGTDYLAGLIPALLALGHKVDVIEGADEPFPEGALPVVDGMLLPRLRPRVDELVARGAAALIHHVGAAAGRDEAGRAEVDAIERAMLPRFRLVIATSAPVAARLGTEFGVAAQAAPPGVHDLPRTQPATEQPVVLSVGVLTRRKGHDVLLRAMARLVDLGWSLVIAGDDGREPAYAAELAATVEELGLNRRVTLLANPEPDALRREWERASLFALATRWEGYAASVAEALRRGIPVVVTEGGAAGELVPADAGAVCSIEDPATFSKCLRRVLFDGALRADMADAAWKAGQKLPSWEAQARVFAGLLGS